MTTSNQPTRARGVYAALPTPRQPDLMEADAGILLEYLDSIAQAGVDGLVLFGSTGEFIHFDTEERTRVLSLAIHRSRVPVLVNVSHSTLVGSIHLARNAIDSGAAGLLIMPPYFYTYSAEHIASFYTAFAAELAGSVPLYLYNLPMYTTAISPDVAERLLSSGAYAGIKDSTPDWSAFEPLLALRAKLDFSLMVGNEAIYLRGRMAGADGIVSGIAGALPELLLSIERAIEEAEADRAASLDNWLQEFVAWVNKLPATVAIKQAADVRGWHVAQFAAPFDAHTNAEFTAFQRWLDNWVPQILAECAEVRHANLK